MDCAISLCYIRVRFQHPGIREFPSGFMGMIVSFFKGTLRQHAGGSLDAVWAETPWGTMLRESTSEHAHKVDSLDVLARDPITTCELPGLDEAGMETLVFNILEGDYLERSGVKGKDDAVVFLLVNEALHTLEEIQRKERL